MSVSTRKSISKLLGIWTFFLLFLLKGSFPKPAIAFVPTPAPAPAFSSLGACFRDPKCAAVLLMGAGSNGAATWHHFDEAHKQQMQEKARQKYCLVYPTDWVCSGQSSRVPYIVTIQNYSKGLRFGGVHNLRVYGPIEGVITVNYDWELWSGSTSKVFIRARDSAGNVFDYWTCGAGGPQSVWNSLNTEILSIDRQDGKPDTGGPLPWQYWSQEKQEQALKLLNQPDFQDVTKSMPPGVGLNPGDNINDEQIIIPGQPKDDPNTPEDESKTRVVPGPLTIPGSPPSPPPPPLVLPTPNPLPTNPPSSSPSPSPTPAPSPFPVQRLQPPAVNRPAQNQILHLLRLRVIRPIPHQMRHQTLLNSQDKLLLKSFKKFMILQVGMEILNTTNALMQLRST